MRFDQAFDPFRALKASWTLLLRAPLTMLLGGVLLVLLDGGGGGGGNFQTTNGHVDGMEGVAIAAIVACACLFGLAIFAFTSLLRVGYPRAIERVMSTGEQEVSDLFKNTDSWLSMVLTQLLSILIVFATLIPGAVVIGLLAFAGHEVGGEGLAAGVGILGGLLYLPFVIYVALGIYLAPYAVSLERLDPLGAIERAWRLADGNRLRLLLYAIVMAVFTMLGLLACCVGIFVTGTMAHIGTAESYIRAIRPDGDQADWWLRPDGEGSGEGLPPSVPPPPPPSEPYPPSEPPPPPPPLGGTSDIPRT